VFVNSLAYIPYALIQGAGRPDLTAKLHVSELPFYLALLWALTQEWGINGVAGAWTLRVGFDAVMLYAVVTRILPESVPTIRRAAGWVIAALVVFALAAVDLPMTIKALFVLVVLAGFALLAWRFIFGPAERDRVRTAVRALVR
jgi:O-antigen/teichoic acid export membrane protein